ncbi:MAG: DUF4178 domain-containing protein [Cytophagales bacterium]|nr:MAG: DUF4178 domain-containing protein [Cytophagales bacterium]TAF60042.1 MAG: DUF4178 domain-containing protein [Cytophagales bacterium]
MSTQIIPSQMVQDLPYAVSVQLASMPVEAQREFIDEYSSKSRSIAVNYFLHFFFGAGYLYLNKWIKQILFWMTAGGGGVWLFINLFRIPKMTQEFNARLADDILRDLVFRYRLNPPQAAYNRIPEVRPKQLPSYQFNPADLQPVNLKAGYMFDFMLKTWSVQGEKQCDWDNQVSERELLVVDRLNGHRAHLYMTHSAPMDIFFCYPVNLAQISPTMEADIQANGRPDNMVSYNNTPFYREIQREGLCFDITGSGTHQRVMVWLFFDGLRENVLRVERKGRNQIEGTIGRVIQSYEISDILPHGNMGDF